MLRKVVSETADQDITSFLLSNSRAEFPVPKGIAALNDEEDAEGYLERTLLGKQAFLLLFI